MAGQLKHRYDIIINGGGIVGFTLLNLIRQSAHLKNTRVLLIEQAKKPPTFKQPPRVDESHKEDGEEIHDIKFSNRVSSITPASRELFKQIKVWDKVKDFAKDANKIKVWNYDYNHKIVFKSEQQGALFTVIENNRISLALLDCLHKNIGQHDLIKWNHSLDSLGRGEAKLIDVTASKEGKDIELTAPLVLGCDGFRSKVRELTGMQYREIDLKKTAVVGTVKLDTYIDSDNDVAYQRFSTEKDTVAALLPLDNQHSSFVISAPNAYAEHLMGLDDASFIMEFNRLLSTEEASPNPLLRNLLDASNLGFDLLHGALRNSGLPKPSIDFDSSNLEGPPQLESVLAQSRASFPLVFGSTSPKMVSPLSGVVVLGDSSHRVHPLAGQGLNLGIQDAFELVHQLENVAKCGERVFDEYGSEALDEALTKFERRRQAYIVPIMGGILAMPHLFKLTPSRFVSVFNQCEEMKTRLIRFASG